MMATTKRLLGRIERIEQATAGRVTSPRQMSDAALDASLQRAEHDRAAAVRDLTGASDTDLARWLADAERVRGCRLGDVGLRDLADGELDLLTEIAERAERMQEAALIPKT